MSRSRRTRLILPVLLGMFVVVRVGPLCLPAQAAPLVAMAAAASNCHEMPAPAPVKAPALGKAGCNAICAPLPVNGLAMAGLVLAGDTPPACRIARLAGNDPLPPLPPPRLA